MVIDFYMVWRLTCGFFKAGCFEIAYLWTPSWFCIVWRFNNSFMIRPFKLVILKSNISMESMVLYCTFISFVGL